jgi:hypothetical protein
LPGLGGVPADAGEAMGQSDELVSLYLDDDITKALLIGGPDDGMELELRGPVRPRLLMPDHVDVTAMLDSTEVRVSSHLVYDLARDGYGLPRRNDQGDVTYVFLGRQ